MRRGRWVAVLLVALVAGCAGTGGPTTPPTPPTSGGRDRPGRPGNALYAYKVVGGRVGEVAGASFKAVPLPVPARDWEDIRRDRQGNLWIADIGNNECRRTDTPC